MGEEPGSVSPVPDAHLPGDGSRALPGVILELGLLSLITNQRQPRDFPRPQDIIHWVIHPGTASITRKGSRAETEEKEIVRHRMAECK